MLKIQPRDLKILSDLSKYGILSSEQIGALHFKGLHHTVLMRRLRMLESAGFILRIDSLPNNQASFKVSPAYTVKILRILNAWGQFYTKQSGGTGIEAVRMPRGKARQDIAKAYQKKKEYRGPADPLSPKELDDNQTNFPDGNYNWMYLSIWLGLRPEEIDNLKKKDHYKFTTAEDGETPILWVFQTKLTSVSEDKAWKPIPLFLPEQTRCTEMITVGNLKRPLNKTLRKIFTEKRITGYSGRKAFTDLMQEKGQALEEISIWLGHTSIETTWKHYKQKQVVRFKKSA